jgi:hypothetical protein
MTANIAIQIHDQLRTHLLLVKQVLDTILVVSHGRFRKNSHHQLIPAQRNGAHEARCEQP